jgi:hypothetical protein
MIEKHGGLVVEQSYINEILRRNTNNWDICSPFSGMIEFCYL